MMQEQNDSKHDIDNLSFDNIYPNINPRQYRNDTEKLLRTNSNNNCCDHICIWCFFHSSPGLNTYEENTDNKRFKYICNNCCTWCLECKFCIKEIDCCCFRILFE
jgi:hypothetical protein